MEIIFELYYYPVLCYSPVIKYKEVIQMAGKKRRVAEKDYDALIQASESKIEKWTNDIKEERKTLKQLKKDKERFEEQKAIEAAEKEKEEIVEMIAKSGKSLDEIKKLLTK